MGVNERVDFTIGMKVDQASFNKVQRQLSGLLSSINSKQTKGNAITSELNSAKQSAQTLQSILSKTYNAKLGTIDTTAFRKEVDKAGTSIQSLYRDIVKGGGNEGAIAVNTLTSSIIKQNKQVKQGSKLVSEMYEQFGKTIKWGISSSVFNTVANALNRAVNYSVALDSSLNDIRIVSGQSADNMRQFADWANKAAKDLGASTTDVTNAALLYYQQGDTEKDVKRKTEITQKVANVTGQDTATASDQLTAIWNGFQVSNEEMEKYADKLAGVAATSASSFEELSRGMQKVAATANTTGVNVDQLTGHLATIISTTREAPETVGTALKTIYARMGDLKVEGKATDEDGFTTSLGTVTSQMQTMGVNILDETGQVRDLGNVIEEVGSKWQGWTRAQQEAAAVALAGKRQYTQLMALFNSWDMYESVVDTSANAEGTLDEQQEIYEQRLTTMKKQLGATAEGIMTDVFNPEMVAPFLEGLTEVVDAIDHISNAFDSLFGMMPKGIGLFTTLGGILTRVFSKNIQNSIKTKLTDVNVNQSNKDKRFITGELANEETGKPNEDFVKELGKVKTNQNSNTKESTTSVSQKTTTQSSQSVISQNSQRGNKHQAQATQTNSTEKFDDKKVIQPKQNDNKATKSQDKKSQGTNKTNTAQTNQKMKRDLQVVAEMDTPEYKAERRKAIEAASSGAERNILQDNIYNRQAMGIDIESENPEFYEQVMNYAKSRKKYDANKEVLKISRQEAEALGVQEQYNRALQSPEMADAVNQEFQNKNDSIKRKLQKDTANIEAILEKTNDELELDLQAQNEQVDDEIKNLEEQIQVKQEVDAIEKKIKTLEGKRENSNDLVKRDEIKKEIDELKEQLQAVDEMTEFDVENLKSSDLNEMQEELEQKRTNKTEEKKKNLEKIREDQEKNRKEAQKEKDKLEQQAQEKMAVNEQQRQVVQDGAQAKHQNDAMEQNLQNQKDQLDVMDESINKAQIMASSYELVSSALTGVTSALQGVGAIKGIWTDEDLTATEKFTQTLTVLGTTIPMVISSVNGLRESWTVLSELGKKITAESVVSQGAETVATNIATEAKKKNTEAEQENADARRDTAEAAGEEAAAETVEAGVSEVAEGAEDLAEGAEDAADTAKDLAEGAEDAAGALNNASDAAEQAGGAVESLGGVSEKVKNAIKGLTQDVSSVGPALLQAAKAAGPYVLAVGAVVAALGTWYAVYKAYDDMYAEHNENTKAFKKSVKEAKAYGDEMAKQNQEWKNSLANMETQISAIKSYEEIVNTSVQGTSEWTNNVSKLNGELSDLIEKLPDLEKYVTLDAHGNYRLRDNVSTEEFEEEAKKEAEEKENETQVKSLLGKNYNKTHADEEVANQLKDEMYANASYAAKGSLLYDKSWIKDMTPEDFTEAISVNSNTNTDTQIAYQEYRKEFKDKEGTTVFKKGGEELLRENGKFLVDKNGNPVTESDYYSGEIKKDEIHEASEQERQKIGKQIHDKEIKAETVTTTNDFAVDYAKQIEEAQDTSKQAYASVSAVAFANKFEDNRAFAKLSDSEKQAISFFAASSDKDFLKGLQEAGNASGKALNDFAQSQGYTSEKDKKGNLIWKDEDGNEITEKQIQSEYAYSKIEEHTNNSDKMEKNLKAGQETLTNLSNGLGMSTSQLAELVANVKNGGNVTLDNFTTEQLEKIKPGSDLANQLAQAFGLTADELDDTVANTFDAIDGIKNKYGSELLKDKDTQLSLSSRRFLAGEAEQQKGQKTVADQVATVEQIASEAATKNKDSIVQAFSRIDWGAEDVVGNFKKQLKIDDLSFDDLNLETDKLADKLEELQDAMIAAGDASAMSAEKFSTMWNTIQGLKSGDAVSGDQVNALKEWLGEENFNKFFSRTLDTKDGQKQYVLTGNADEMRNSARDNSEILNGDASNRKDAWTERTGVTKEARTMALASMDDINTLAQANAELTEMNAQMDILNTQYINGGKYSKAEFTEVVNGLKTSEKYTKQLNNLKKIDDNKKRKKEIKELNLEIKQQAIQYLNSKNALQELGSKWNDIYKTIKKGMKSGKQNTKEYKEAIETVRNSLQEAFGSENLRLDKIVSDSFIEKHASLINKMLNGDEDAFYDFQQELANSDIMNDYIKEHKNAIKDNFDSIKEFKNKWQDSINDISKEVRNMKPGDTLKENLVENLQGIIEATGGSVNEMQALFDSLSINIDAHMLKPTDLTADSPEVLWAYQEENPGMSTDDYREWYSDKGLRDKWRKKTIAKNKKYNATILQSAVKKKNNFGDLVPPDDDNNKNKNNNKSKDKGEFYKGQTTKFERYNPDVYEKIDEALAKIETRLQRLTTLQEYLYGDKLTNNLKQQLELLKDKVKYAIQEERLSKKQLGNAEKIATATKKDQDTQNKLDKAKSKAEKKKLKKQIKQSNKEFDKDFKGSAAYKFAKVIRDYNQKYGKKVGTKTKTITINGKSVEYLDDEKILKDLFDTIKKQGDRNNELIKKYRKAQKKAGKKGREKYRKQIEALEKKNQKLKDIEDKAKTEADNYDQAISKHNESLSNLTQAYADWIEGLTTLLNAALEEVNAAQERLKESADVIKAFQENNISRADNKLEKASNKVEDTVGMNRYNASQARDDALKALIAEKQDLWTLHKQDYEDAKKFLNQDLDAIGEGFENGKVADEVIALTNKDLKEHGEKTLTNKQKDNLKKKINKTKTDINKLTLKIDDMAKNGFTPEEIAKINTNAEAIIEDLEKKMNDPNVDRDSAEYAGLSALYKYVSESIIPNINEKLNDVASTEGQVISDEAEAEQLKREAAQNKFDTMVIKYTAEFDTIQLQKDLASVHKQVQDAFTLDEDVISGWDNIVENFDLVLKSNNTLVKKYGDLSNIGGEEYLEGKTYAELEDIQQKYTTNLTDLISGYEQALQKYGEALSKTSTTISEWSELLNARISGMEQYYNIANTTNSNDVYKQNELAKLQSSLEIQTMEQNTTFSFLKTEIERNISEYQKAKQAHENANEEDKNTYEEQMKMAQKNVQSSASNAISSIATRFSNQLSVLSIQLTNIFHEGFKTLSGALLEEAQEAFSWLQTTSKRYLDKTERKSETEGFSAYANKLIADTDNITYQNKLTEIYREQLKILQQKEKISQYDIDRAKKLLDLEIKRQALEDARNNKTTMKLRRDSSGNYSYQYVADPAKLAQAQSDYDSAKNDVYELDKQKITELVNTYYSDETKYKQELAALYNKGYTTEEFNIELAKLEDKYLSNIADIGWQFKDVFNNIKSSSGLNWSAMSDAEREQTLSMIGIDSNSIETIMNIGSGSYKAQIEKMNKDALDTYANMFSTEKQAQKQMQFFVSAIGDVTKSASEMGTVLSKIQADVPGAISEINPKLYAFASAISSTINSLEKVNKKLQEMQGTNDKDASDDPGSRDKSSSSSKSEADSSTATKNASDKTNNTTTNTSTTTKSANSKTTVSSKIKPGYDGTKVIYPKLKDRVGKWIKNKEHKGLLESAANPGGTLARESVIAQIYSIWRKTDQKKKKVPTMSQDIKYAIVQYLKDYKIKGFKSGGYTGDWSTSTMEKENGKLAWLHQKELVLNATDTENMLKSVGLVRKIANQLNGNSTNGLNQLVQNLTTLNNAGNISNCHDTNQDVQVNINADFPSVQSSVEIEKAFKNLTSVALQKASMNTNITTARTTI